MKKLVLLISGLLIATSIPAEMETYQVEAGDSLVEILKTREFGSDYRQLLPFIEETIRLNPEVFNDGNADKIVPGAQLLLPENPFKKVEEPVVVAPVEPEPIPEPIVEPEPVSEPEPEFIGRIVVKHGEAVILRDGEAFEVIEKDRLVARDIVSTMQNTVAEIELTDNTLFTLGSKSKFSIDEYSFSEQEVQQNNSIDTMIATFHEGFLRAISGLIARSVNSDYQVNSSLTVTIGVRGTDFTVRSCLVVQQCGDLFGVSAAVQDGGISFKNEASEINLDKNQFTNIKTASEVPKPGPIPEGFFDINKAVNEIEGDKVWWQHAVDWFSDLL